MAEESVAASKPAGHGKNPRVILEAFTSLFDKIGDRAADIVADDMEETSLFDSVLKNKAAALKVFLTGTAVGACLSYAVVARTIVPDRDQTVELLKQETLDTTALTPVADISVPLESINVTNDEAPSVQTTVLAPDTVEKFEIKPRQNLSSVLKNGGLTNREVYLVSEALTEVLNLKQIQAGDIVEIGKTVTDDAEKTALLLSVTIEDRKGNRYTAARADADLFEASVIEPEVDLKTEYAVGEIDGAFINNAKQAGVPTNVVQQIIWAFDGPVDFVRDLRKGDSFTAVFQKEYNKSGNPTGNGELLYASFDLHGTVHERYLYKDSKGHEDYYDEKGRIARKLFTMHPLKSPRVTSLFGQRKHPILGYSTMHWGTDYGVPVGTPIRSPGEGTVTQAGRKGTYGRYIQIKHNSEYSTAYAHLNQIGDKIYVGKKVKAGEIIGYSGNSGRSTGPHLHWELIKNGKKINPSTQRITAQRRLIGSELDSFYAMRDSMRENMKGDIAYAKAEALPEDRKLAYQEPEKPKKVRRSAKPKPQRTAFRQTNKRKG